MKYFIKKSWIPLKKHNCKKSCEYEKIVNRYLYLFLLKKSREYRLEKTGFCNIKIPVKTKTF